MLFAFCRGERTFAAFPDHFHPYGGRTSCVFTVTELQYFLIRRILDRANLHVDYPENRLGNFYSLDVFHWLQFTFWLLVESGCSANHANKGPSFR